MPSLCRGFAVEILVRADMVVPVAKCFKVMVELRDACYLPLVEFLFEGAEQTLDSAVLPRASGVSKLVANTELLQPKTEFARSKNRFVVGADDFRFAVGEYDFADAGNQGARAFIAQCLQVQQGAAAVVEYAEQEM